MPNPALITWLTQDGNLLGVAGGAVVALVLGLLLTWTRHPVLTRIGHALMVIAVVAAVALGVWWVIVLTLDL